MSIKPESLKKCRTANTVACFATFMTFIFWAAAFVYAGDNGKANHGPGNDTVRQPEDTSIVRALVDDELKQDVIAAEAELTEIKDGVPFTISDISGDAIQALPARSIAEVIALQNSVVNLARLRQSQPEFHIRGGREYHTGYYLNNVSIMNPINGIVTVSISPHAIRDISFYPGGLSAEYGFANSGLFDLVSRTGSDAYSGMIEAVSDNIGGSGYDQNWYTARLSGPFPFLKNAHFFGLLERRWFANRNPSSKTEEILPGNPKRLPGNWLRGWTYHGKVDYDIRSNINLSFAADYSIDNWSEYRHEFLFDIDHMPRYKDKYLGLSGSFNHSLTPEMTYSVTGTYYASERTRGDGEVFDDLEAYVRDYLYGNPMWDSLNLFREHDEVWMIIDSETGDTTYIHAASFWEEFLHHKSTCFGLSGRVNRQLGRYHTAAVGFDYRRRTLRYYEHYDATDGYRVWDVNHYGFDRYGNESDDLDYRNETKRPTEISVYIEDRFAKNGIVIKGGLRLDRFDYNTLKLKDIENPFDPGNATGVDTLDPGDLEPTKAINRLSPRFGLAYSASGKARIHFNYGIYYQWPLFYNMFSGWDFFAVRVASGAIIYMASNPDLEPEKTIQYEAGIEYQLNTNVIVGITAYHKDTRNQVQLFYQLANPCSWDYYANTDHGTIKGLEFKFSARQGRRLRVDFDYTLSSVKGISSYPNSLFDIGWKNPEYLPVTEMPLDYDQRHSIVGMIHLRTTTGEGLKIGRVSPFEDLSLKAVIQAASGRPYTPMIPYDAAREGIAVWEGPTGAVNSQNMSWAFSIDTKIERRFRIGEFSITPFIWVKNVLNRANITWVYPGTGEPDNTGWLNTPEGINWLEMHNSPAEDGMTAEERYRLKENDPGHYGPPRQVYFGLRVSF